MGFLFGQRLVKEIKRGKLPKGKTLKANDRKFLLLVVNPQLETPLTMAVSAARGVTSTTRPLMGTSSTSLGSAITSLPPTANLPTRISTSRSGVQWRQMPRWSLTSSWRWKEQWLNWLVALSILMANCEFITLCTALALTGPLEWAPLSLTRSHTAPEQLEGSGPSCSNKNKRDPTVSSEVTPVSILFRWVIPQMLPQCYSAESINWVQFKCRIFTPFQFLLHISFTRGNLQQLLSLDWTGRGWAVIAVCTWTHFKWASLEISVYTGMVAPTLAWGVKPFQKAG